MPSCPPSVRRSLTPGCGLSASARIFRSMRVNSVSSSASNSFCADCLMSRGYLSTRAGALQAVGAVLLVGNALFLPAGFRHKTLPEVLPNGPVFFQIDLNGDLTAFLVGHELDSDHGFIVLQQGFAAHPTPTVRRWYRSTGSRPRSEPAPAHSLPAGPSALCQTRRL